MNQILSTNNNDGVKKQKSINNYSSNNNGDMKKILMFFGIAIITFGTIIAGVYGYKIFKNNKPSENIISKPDLSIEQTDNKLKILAKSDAGLSKLIYTWNDEQPAEEDLSGRTSQELSIDILNGENTLKIKVIDMNGNEKEIEKEFSISGDAQKPNIETAVVESSRLKITVTDESAMKYIAYRWNNEEDVKVDVENEGDALIETIIDIKRGQNTLTITGVDSSDNAETVERIFNGVNKPVIDWYKQGQYLYMTISHDMGFKSIEFSLNGNEYKYDENYSGYDSTKQKIEYKFKLKEGENTVTIKAVSTEDTQTERKGKCTYTAQ